MTKSRKGYSKKIQLLSYIFNSSHNFKAREKLLNKICIMNMQWTVIHSEVRYKNPSTPSSMS